MTSLHPYGNLRSGTDLYPVIPLFGLLLLLQLLWLLLLLLLMVWLVTMGAQEALVTRQQGRHQAPRQVAGAVGQLGHGGADIRGAELGTNNELVLRKKILTLTR